jgi:hypothetical protein
MNCPSGIVSFAPFLRRSARWIRHVRGRLRFAESSRIVAENILHSHQFFPDVVLVQRSKFWSSFDCGSGPCGRGLFLLAELSEEFLCFTR